MQEEIEFNYFHQMFRKENQKKFWNIIRNKISSQEDEMEQELMLIFPEQYLNKEEKLEVYDRSLFHVCANYIRLSDSKMDVSTNNTFEFVLDILDEIEYNPYKYSFLVSLQFIYQEYLDTLAVGRPSLFQHTKDIQESYMEIMMDSLYQILQFDCINMNLLDQTKTMTKFVMMQKNQELGPLHKVKYHYRKDI